VWGIVLAVMLAIVAGDVSMNPAKAYAYEESDVVEISTSGGEGEMDGKIQSITFKKNMRITDALRFLSAKYQKNIVPSSKVEGLITVTNLYDVTFEEALEAILGHGYKYDQEGNFINVYTAEEYKNIKEDMDRMITKVFVLYYISAAEAEKLIAPAISKVGTIQASSPADTVVPTGESISSGSAGGDSMALNDTVVIHDYPENIAEAERLLKELDARPKQVLVEATILSATLSESTKFGIDLNLLAGVSLTGTASTGDLVGHDQISRGSAATTPIQQVASGTAGTPIEVAGFAAAGGSGLRIGVTTGDVSAFITALEEVTDTTILANPKILAVNKQLGQVYIGNKIGYVSQTTQTQTSTTQQVEFLETGTKLSFRPYIGGDGYIRMDIQPKDSSGTLKSNNIPDESSTELATNIIVKDGQTIVIGGLFRDVVITSRSQVPLLGDLPFVGAAFRGTTDTNQRQEVIVLLTPHIIEESAETNSEARMEDIKRKRLGAKNGMQWIDRARLAEDHYANASKYYLEGNTETAMKALKVALELRPAYLEAIRLQERINSETDPNSVSMFERNVLDTIEEDDSQRWRRR
jgi:type IV pilus assembly protein PilQ